MSKSIARLVLPEVRELLLEGSQADIAHALAPFHSADIADLIEELEDEEACLLLLGLADEQQTETFEQLQLNEQVRLVLVIGAEDIAPIVSRMASDDRADLVNELPPDVLPALLTRLPAEEAKDVVLLANYGDETAGGRMTSEFLRLQPDMTASQAIERIREQASDKETIFALFVLGGNDQLLGVVSLEKLILAPVDTLIREIMYDNPISLPVSADQETVARSLGHYDFLAMPIVDAEGKMVGIVTHDDAHDITVEEQTEDAEKMAGVEPLQAPYFATSVLTLVRKRAFWLGILFVAGLAAGSILKGYEDILERTMALIFFLPLIIAAGGNSGSQSATLVIRGMAVGEMKISDWWRVAGRELISGLALGSMLGVFGVTTAWLWGKEAVAVTVMLTLIAIVTVGSLLGSLLPMGLARVGIDPAITSSPMVAALVDILGILIYVSIAALLIAI